MTVQELFKQVDKNEFIEHYLKNDGETLDVIFGSKYSLEEKIKLVQRFKDVVSESFEKMRNLELEKDSEYICFAIPYVEDENFGWDSFVSKREDILNKDTVERVEKYAYELSPVEDTLKCDVSETCIKSYGELEVAVAIFNELTFCGVDFDRREERQEEIHNDLNESLKEIDEAKEKGEEIKGIPAEDVFKSFGWVDERKPFEKEFDMNRMRCDGEHFMKLYKMIIDQEFIYITKNY